MIRRNLILPATVAMSVALISSAALAASPQRDMSQAFNADPPAQLQKCDNRAEARLHQPWTSGAANLTPRQALAHL